LVYPPIIVKNKMKAVMAFALLMLIIGNIPAVDIDSYQFIDHLRTISKPGKPEIFQDGVLFTASSSHRRVGISFAHEGYARVYWFRQLMIPRDPAEFYANGKRLKNIEPNVDSGILFHIETIPANLKNLDYRLIIDGLWTTDPINPISVTGPSGITESRITLPEKPKPFLDETPPGTYRFIYRSDPGELITVGGSFNNWDPFMYELREISPGFYTLILPLPPGNFQYLFFQRGEHVPDPENPKRLYNREGRAISEGQVRR
jgi:hypothetical protein